MGRNDTELTKVSVDTGFLVKYQEDTSLEQLEAYRVIPRMKIIQSMTSKELRDQFGEGSVVLTPGDVSLWKDGDKPITVIPILFFPEFIKWADLKDSSQSIVDRTFDPTSDIAKRAKNPEMRRQAYEGDENKDDNDKSKRFYRYVEHLCFYVMIAGDHDQFGNIALLEFSRGEYKTGSNFISAISMRRVSTADGSKQKVPLWAQVWDINTKYNSPDSNRQWYGWEFHPNQSPVIDSTMSDQMFGLHREFKELFEKKKVVSDFGATDDEDVVNNEDF